MNRYGANVSPCRVPATMSKKSVSPSSEWTFTFMFLMVATVPLGRPYTKSICSTFPLSMELNALEKSANKSVLQMHTDYADDIPLLVNTPTQSESLLHSLEQAVGGIGLYVNGVKMEYMCVNLLHNNSVLTQDVILKTCQKWWKIDKWWKRESGKSILAVQHDDDI